MTTVRYFAAAADAAGTMSETVGAATLGELLDRVREDHGRELATVLDRCSLLLDGVRVSDPATPLADGSTLDVLPPFAGG